MKTSTLAALLLFCATLTVRAQTTISPSHHKAALELLVAMQTEKSLEQSIQTAMEAQIASDSDLVPFRDIMEGFLKKYMSWESIKDELADLYAGEFTEDELHQLTKFYRTEVGKKMAGLTPTLIAKAGAIGQQKVESHVSELQSLILKKMMETQGTGTEEQKEGTELKEM